MAAVGRGRCRGWIGSIFKLKPDIVKSDDDGDGESEGSVRILAADSKDGLSPLPARRTQEAGRFELGRSSLFQALFGCSLLTCSLLAARCPLLLLTPI